MRPDVAIDQRAAERHAGQDHPDGRPQPDTPPVRPTPRPDVSYPAQKVLTRFYGVKTLNAERFAMDFRNVAEEVLAHLRVPGSSRLTVRLEIEATDSAGFDEAQIRTVSENARTLKFDSAGFEEA